MSAKKWSSEENEFLMRYAYKAPWPQIAASLGRTEVACKDHFNKIMKLRQVNATWKGITP
jgi:hypothetical protein